MYHMSSSLHKLNYRLGTQFHSFKVSTSSSSGGDFQRRLDVQQLAHELVGREAQRVHRHRPDVVDAQTAVQSPNYSILVVNVQ